MAGKMRAIVKEKPAKGVAMKNVPIPKVGRRDVLVKVKAAGICGTDQHIYNWDAWSQNRIVPPLTIGHEMCGIVEQVGEGVAYVSEGDFVSLESHVICKECYQCRTGNAHVCSRVSILGVDRDGVFADYVSVPDIVVWKNDKKLPVEIACVQEPMGNAVFVTEAAEVTGKTIVIFGCGPAGLFSTAISRKTGAGQIIAVDVSDYRLKLAKKMGADVTLNPKEVDVGKTVKELTDGIGAEAVLELSGNPKAVKDSFKSVADAGTVILFGLPNQEVPIDLAKEIIFKGVTVKGITGRRMYNTWYRLKGLLQGGLDIRQMITHKIDFGDYEKGFELMNSGNCGKVMMKINGD